MGSVNPRLKIHNVTHKGQKHTHIRLQGDEKEHTASALCVAGGTELAHTWPHLQRLHPGGSSPGEPEAVATAGDGRKAPLTWTRSGPTNPRPPRTRMPRAHRCKNNVGSCLGVRPRQPLWGANLKCTSGGSCSAKGQPEIRTGSLSRSREQADQHVLATHSPSWLGQDLPAAPETRPGDTETQPRAPETQPGAPETRPGNIETDRGSECSPGAPHSGHTSPSCLQSKHHVVLESDKDSPRLLCTAPRSHSSNVLGRATSPGQAPPHSSPSVEDIGPQMQHGRRTQGRSKARQREGHSPLVLKGLSAQAGRGQRRRSHCSEPWEGFPPQMSDCQEAGLQVIAQEATGQRALLQTRRDPEDVGKV